MGRRDDLDRLYDLLDRLDDRVGGAKTLTDCTGYMDWPERGLYVFFADGETRDGTEQPRLTRVGTHAVSSGSGASLWERLRAHRGVNSGTFGGGGNHRMSVFRKRVGEAMIHHDGIQEELSNWGEGNSANRDTRHDEHDHEVRVSEYIRDLPFLWIDVDDEPGPDSERAYLESNLIALVSNYKTEPIDPRASDWLGGHCPSEPIRNSGLWNVNHVDEAYDSNFLTLLETRIDETEPID
ncbi:hypothetical protein Halru_0595 [Halovivax ruber XH-70]|uniref:GIY-YIG domain-containing protein n=1 Tax=Halovivax ruber (strain DSM 18193 / JCM 13892 / XH-70) TaxID=797302 RepID=L0IAF7_HALRX|nr:hypothetical protein [Halovivax ruber]AGB15226.1 hypothetical protein Halru_0595 [Halovivax ruber XH-70]